jgi:uncharacterized membrane-anchored protein
MISVKHTAFLSILLTLLALPAAAQNNAASAGSASAPVWLEGPRDVPLAGQGVLKLPKDYVYQDGEEARKSLRKMGNPHVDDVLGLISGGNGDWFAVVRFEKAGYIKDDDAKDWKTDDLFDSLKKGTEESNEARRKQGIAEMEIVGWVEKPHYEASTHRLVWALSSKDKGSDGSDQGINYNTYALGREGYFSVNLVTDLKKIEQNKPHAMTLLSSLDYDAGKKYTDFNASTDKVAAYGLTALVAGVAAKKLGLLAVIAAFFLKFAKLFILAGIGLLALIGKFFGGKKAPAETPTDKSPGQV